jgi:tRNA modification GTPase
MTTASEPSPDTIAAISTPPGRGGIGIVRIAGPDALPLTKQLLALKSPLEHARATLTRVLDPADPAATIDEAMVTAYFAPHSYTGDTLIEIAAHGSPVVLEALLRGALALGARLAEPGEFTRRAFLSGRIDLTQAEAVHDLITAQTLDQARIAAQQLGGALSRRIAPAKESLLHLIALLEAGMDFASGELDDVAIVPPAQIALSIDSLISPLEALAATFARGALLRNGAAIAIVGRPNAGKSSLFNRLLHRDRAIVTPLPGTTRDTLEESVSLGGIPIRLIDTAGLRITGADLAEQHGIARTHATLADADLILLVRDATQPVTKDDLTLAASLAGRPHLLVANKIDLLTPADQGPTQPALSLSKDLDPEPAKDESRTGRPAIPTSALTGSGLDDLRSAILAQLGAAGSVAESGLLNNLRQQQAVTAALTALQAAATANSAGLPHEMILLDLHSALRALDSLTGATTPDDILVRIFSTFCIGK